MWEKGQSMFISKPLPSAPGSICRGAQKQGQVQASNVAWVSMWEKGLFHVYKQTSAECAWVNLSWRSEAGAGASFIRCSGTPVGKRKKGFSTFISKPLPSAPGSICRGVQKRGQVQASYAAQVHRWEKGKRAFPRS